MVGSFLLLIRSLCSSQVVADIIARSGQPLPAVPITKYFSCSNSASIIELEAQVSTRQSYLIALNHGSVHLFSPSLGTQLVYPGRLMCSWVFCDTVTLLSICQIFLNKAGLLTSFTLDSADVYRPYAVSELVLFKWCILVLYLERTHMTNVSDTQNFHDNPATMTHTLINLTFIYNIYLPISSFDYHGKIQMQITLMNRASMAHVMAYMF